MQDIWYKVDEKLAETKGAFPQVEAGMWRADYAVLLREMDEKDEKENDKKGGGDVVEMEVDNELLLPPSVLSIYGSAEETDPKTVVESFQARQIPGFRLASTRNESTIVVSLELAGLTFEIQEALTTTTETTSETTTTNTTNKPEYRVSTRQHLPLSKPTASAGTSRLETAIVQQLNSRPRKWDLRYLLVRPPPPFILFKILTMAGTHTLLREYKESSMQEMCAIDGFVGSVTCSSEGGWIVYHW